MNIVLRIFRALSDQFACPAVIFALSENAPEEHIRPCANGNFKAVPPFAVVKRLPVNHPRHVVVREAFRFPARQPVLRFGKPAFRSLANERLSPSFATFIFCNRIITRITVPRASRPKRGRTLPITPGGSFRHGSYPVRQISRHGKYPKLAFAYLAHYGCIPA